MDKLHKFLLFWHKFFSGWCL